MAETSCLLNSRTVYGRTEGSNPSLSATEWRGGGVSGNFPVLEEWKSVLSHSRRSMTKRRGGEKEGSKENPSKPIRPT